MTLCPFCQETLESHADKDCIIPMLNRIKQLERIVNLCAEREFHPPSLESHELLIKALREAGYGS